MSGAVLIVRPEPGASETAARARALGLQPVVAPLFIVRPLAWHAPQPAKFDAVMLTSANAARHAGDGLTPFLGLPCYAVGEATAETARQAGFAKVRTGGADAAALIAAMAADGVVDAFHPCGLDRTVAADPAVRVESVPVYAAEARPGLPPEAAAAVDAGALVLIHSPRAADRFARLVHAPRSAVAIAAISPAAAAAAGGGWRDVAVAPRPRDEALLELAAKLCQTGAE